MFVIERMSVGGVGRGRLSWGVLIVIFGGINHAVEKGG